MAPCNILSDAGYRCHEAATAEQALEILAEQGAHIRLLFSDVQMPPGSLTGFDLARQCARDWPEIGILIASGGMTPGPGDLPPGAEFISKRSAPTSCMIISGRSCRTASSPSSFGRLSIPDRPY